MKKYYTLLLLLGIAVSGFSQDKLKALDKDLSTVNYPFKVNYKSIDSQEQELRMAYLDVAPKKNNGKTVVLLHGKNFNAAYWEKTIKELNKKGFRVIAPDQVGFGKSTKPEHYQYSFSQLAANTKSILDSLKIRTVVVLGHSMGGDACHAFCASISGNDGETGPRKPNRAGGLQNDDQIQNGG